MKDRCFKIFGFPYSSVDEKEFSAEEEEKLKDLATFLLQNNKKVVKKEEIKKGSNNKNEKGLLLEQIQKVLSDTYKNITIEDGYVFIVVPVGTYQIKIVKKLSKSEQNNLKESDKVKLNIFTLLLNHFLNSYESDKSIIIPYNNNEYGVTIIKRRSKK